MRRRPLLVRHKRRTFVRKAAVRFLPDALNQRISLVEPQIYPGPSYGPADLTLLSANLTYRQWPGYSEPLTVAPMASAGIAKESLGSSSSQDRCRTHLEQETSSQIRSENHGVARRPIEFATVHRLVFGGRLGLCGRQHQDCRLLARGRCRV